MAALGSTTPSRWLGPGLWLLALCLVFATAVYQRLTGPTHPVRGSYHAVGIDYNYRLIRSDWSAATQPSAAVTLPAPPQGVSGRLHYRRFRSPDPFTATELEPQSEDGQPVLRGLLPAQPAAGKLEYYLELETADGPLRLPAAADGNVVIRFKDHVPATILVPHILCMFLAVLIGLRAGLAAAFAPSDMRRWAWTALALMSVGGMLLGPVVQKYAFGAYWTGWPLGGDWTDNKMLVMWLSWVLACAVIGLRPRRWEPRARLIVLLAALVMTGAYLIPHSMGGSELDYSLVEQGVDPAEAIRTGRQ